MFASDAGNILDSSDGQTFCRLSLMRRQDEERAIKGSREDGKSGQENEKTNADDLLHCVFPSSWCLGSLFSAINAFPCLFLVLISCPHVFPKRLSRPSLFASFPFPHLRPRLMFLCVFCSKDKTKRRRRRDDYPETGCATPAENSLSSPCKSGSFEGRGARDDDLLSFHRKKGKAHPDPETFRGGEQTSSPGHQCFLWLQKTTTICTQRPEKTLTTRLSPENSVSWCACKSLLLWRKKKFRPENGFCRKSRFIPRLLLMTGKRPHFSPRRGHHLNRELRTSDAQDCTHRCPIMTTADTRESLLSCGWEEHSTGMSPHQEPKRGDAFFTLSPNSLCLFMIRAIRECHPVR